MKRFIILITMALTLCATNKAVAHDFEAVNADGKTIYYDIVAGTSNVEVTCKGSTSSIYSNEYTGTINIPTTVTRNGTTYSVTSIGYSAFKGCSGLTSISIPNSVTTIGYSAFEDCSGLTSISLPNSVTTIGNSAFKGCSGLTSISIPNSVTTIGSSAFEGCSSLTSVILSNSVTTIDATFKNCGNLTNVTIGNSVTTIASSAFEGCSSLTSLTLPNSVTHIGDCVFLGCSSLSSIDIPNSVTHIGVSAFENCSSLISLTIPDSVVNVVYRAFFGCSSLTSVTLHNSITYIGDYVFHGCSSLISVDVPNSVTHIGEGAFTACSSLANINVGVENTNYSSVDGVLYNKLQDTIWGYPGGREGDFIIPNTVTTIGDWAFYGCSFPSIDIPNSVTHIGEGAFAGCNSLMNINVEADNTAYSSLNGVVYDKLQEKIICYPGGRQGSFSIPSTVTTIGDGAFNECSGLTSVTIPNSVTTIEHWGLIDCTNLDTVICLAQTPPALGDDCFGFGNNTPTDRYLFVPCNYREAYLQSSAWGWYFESDNIIGEYMTLIEATVNAGTDYTENGFTITNIQENATYTQTLIASDGCDSVIVLSLTVNVGLEEANGEATSAIGLFPNPAEDFATLTLDNLNTKAELVIFDIQGKAIIRKEVAVGESEIRLDLTNLAPGTYSVRITSSEGIITRKLIRR